MVRPSFRESFQPLCHSFAQAFIRERAIAFKRLCTSILIGHNYMERNDTIWNDDESKVKLTS
jgi:hypothetical protein